jgi:hypothetical protein
VSRGSDEATKRTEPIASGDDADQEESETEEDDGDEHETGGDEDEADAPPATHTEGVLQFPPPPDYQSFADALLAEPRVSHLAPLVNATQGVHLDIRIEPSDDPPYHANTILRSIHPAGQDGGSWDQALRGAERVNILTTLVPDTNEDEQGDVMAHLLHELIVHVAPQVEHFNAIKDAGPDANVWEHVYHLFDGNDRQHSDAARWREYLEAAREIGQAFKDRGDIEIGSDIVMSAVNDIMTHTVEGNEAATPQMSEEERRALFNEADQVGIAEGEYRSQHPTTWPLDDDDDDDDGETEGGD